MPRQDEYRLLPSGCEVTEMGITAAAPGSTLCYPLDSARSVLNAFAIGTSATLTIVGVRMAMTRPSDAVKPPHISLLCPTVYALLMYGRGLIGGFIW